MMQDVEDTLKAVEAAGPRRVILGRVSLWSGVVALAAYGSWLCGPTRDVMAANLAGAVGVAVIFFPVACNVVGFVAGIAALVKRDGRRGWAIAGLIINGLFVAVILCMVALTIMLRGFTVG